jgi:hypothetical protein
MPTAQRLLDTNVAAWASLIRETQDQTTVFVSRQIASYICD